MNKIKGLITFSAFSLLVLCLPAIASAQYGNPNGGYNNGGYNNGGYNNGGYNNGQYGNNGYGDISSTARELKDLSRRFEKSLDRSPIYSKNNNNGRYGNYGGYGGYNNNNSVSSVRKLADSFGNAASDLEKSVRNGRYNNNSQNEANRVLNLGSQLDNELRRYGTDGYIQNDWNRIQYDLRIVANNFGNGNYRNNRTGGYNNGSWNNGRVPSWWPF